MIAMALGLLVVGAAVSMFLSFSRTFAASQSLSRVQENARVAFELMARDVREGGGNPCSRYLKIANVLNGAGGTWWNSTNWIGTRGYDNGSLPGSLPGTDAFEVISGSALAASVVNHNPGLTTFVVTPAEHGFVANDILMVCDYGQAAIFQMTGPPGNPVTNGQILHEEDVGSPGNCSKGLGFMAPMDCTTPTGQQYRFDDNAQVVRLSAQRWYVAANGRGGNSLYRVALRGNAVGAAEEVVEGVADMQLTYLHPYVVAAGSYVDATTINLGPWKWPEISAMRVRIVLAGTDRLVPTVA
ncbi:MAG: pilus assembly protein PilW [Xanthomonadales bacterium]|nr:pilus assembly protein PilW [Xanthomonadales bacterium]